jgi:phosphohistidine swiveling domain-containing protein
MDGTLVFLADIVEEDVAQIGGKALNLARMYRNGFSVPDAFVVPVSMYERFLKDSSIDVQIKLLLGGTDFGDSEAVSTASERIRELILSHPISGRLQDSLANACSSFPEGTLFAVRSSAIAEDKDDASFAGQQDTFLNVLIQNVAESSRRCWASYWTARAMTYRQDRHVDQTATGIAVVVQRMVDASSSGIMFTIDPIGKKDQVVIEASWGLGESIASGIVMPDRFVCDRKRLQLIDRRINRKMKGVFLHSEDGVPVDIDQEKQMQPSLDDRTAEELAQIGMKLEKYFGAPQDIEWALDHKGISVLQCRPITTLENKETIWTRAYGDEYWADATTPLFYSFMGDYLTKYVNWEGARIMGYRSLDGVPLLRLHKAHIYFNTFVLEEIFTYNPRFSRTKELLNYFPVQDQVRIANAPTKLAARIMAEIRIAILDRDGTIITNDRAYRRWTKTYMKKMARYDALDLTKLSNTELRGEFEYLEEASLKHYRLIRYGMVSHSIGSNLILKTWLTKWVGDGDGVLYSKIVSGLRGNKTIETNLELYRLAQIVRKNSDLKAMMFDHPPATFLKEMNEERSLAEFKGAFDKFMGNYGHRSHTREIFYPRWSEDPALVLDIVRSLASSPEVDLEAMETRKVAERHKAQREIMDRLSEVRFGNFKKPVFKIVIKFAQTYMMFRENQRFYLDEQLFRARRLFLEYGRRLASQEVLDHQDDVFFLTKEEMFDRAEGRGEDIRTTVRSRIAEFERYGDDLPPKFLQGRIEFDDTVEITGSTTRMTGTAASPGMVEILVTSNTDPGWTAVFSKIGGLITETGGILSHGAVVSREYGIPAVTAVKGATKIFKSGQRITLNGNEGLIYISEG